MNLRICIFILILSSPICTNAQQKARVSSPKLSFAENILSIEYDINNCSVNDRFFVDIQITSTGGEIIDARSLYGDIGKGIQCGRNRIIRWSLAEDSFLLNEEIEVKVIAEPELQEQVVYQPVVMAPRKLGRGDIMVSSLLVPGLGQKRATGKSSYLLLGAAGYGCLGASAYYYLDHTRKYDQYLGATDKDESDRLFAASKRSFDNSLYLAYGAAGIWVANLVWSAIVPIGVSKDISLEFRSNELNGFQVSAAWTF